MGEGMKETLVLGIETSCDETSASVIKNGREVLSNVISSQVNLHQRYGGVVPEIASRRHVETILPVVEEALLTAGISKQHINVVAVTYGPGLVGALLVGVSFAKAFSYAQGIPLVGVHHIEGHIAANYLQYKTLEPPFICLVASGGHSHLIEVDGYNHFEILGKTRDDAAGEAFDKIARALGLGYPGGPLIDQEAVKGNKNAITFPRVCFENSLDFSFSGLKTAAINYLHKAQQNKQGIDIPDVCASFQQAVVEVLSNNLIKAAKIKGLKKVALAGGVAANSALRKTIQTMADKEGMEFYYPSPILCTDNAAMIGAAGYYQYLEGHIANLYLNAIPNVNIGTRE